MKRLLSVLAIMVLVFSAGSAMAEEEKMTKKEKKAAEAAAARAEIDKVAKEAVGEVTKESKTAKANWDKAAGYAVFDNLRVTFIFSGGGGSGVAVSKSSGKKTYMKMGTGGLSLGIGAQKYQVIMFFETEEVLNNFITKGWKAETGASASAGEKGANVATGFINGIAIYQITEKGLMASADISGTKYSVNKDLNEK